MRASAVDIQDKSRATISRAHLTGRRTAWIITFTPASDEPRVLRQTRTLSELGWNVVVCGYEGRTPRPPGWTFIRLTNSDSTTSRRARRMARMRRAGLWLARQDPTGDTLRGVAARLIYFGLPNWSRDHSEILRLAKDHTELAPTLVIAHDVFTCPPAFALARRSGARTIIDSHEYMLGVRMEDEVWVREQRPFIKAMQDFYFARADQIITVSEGIARRLDAEHQLKRPPACVRSLPSYASYPFRPTQPPRTVLYHGIIDRVRNLDIAVRAAAHWKSDTQLLIRGGGDAAHVAELRALIEGLGVGHKVRLEPPVPFSDLIARASEADIGYFVYADGSPQRHYALPNKFFEYTMAGLALVISDLPEMAKLVNSHGLGIICPEVTPEAIAACIDSLSDDAIDCYKQASLQAARTLCWENEQEIFIRIVEDLCGRG